MEKIMLTNTNQLLLTPEETAQLLGIEIETLSVWRCTKRYKLDYVKLGRLVRYKKADVLEFIEQRTIRL